MNDEKLLLARSYNGKDSANQKQERWLFFQLSPTCLIWNGYKKNELAVLKLKNRRCHPTLSVQGYVAG